MSFFTYIIYSDSKDKYYVGYTQDIETRLAKHNNGATRSTRPGRPWILVYSEKYTEKSAAIKLEIGIKKMKSRIYIEQLIRKTQNG